MIFICQNSRAKVHLFFFSENSKDVKVTKVTDFICFLSCHLFIYFSSL